MNNLSDDIIRYKKGELSPKEMHALEKKALSDQFLADALEGADKISSEDFSTDVQFINEKIKGSGKWKIFTPLRIAAGLLLVAVASFLVYQFTSKTEDLALTTNKEKAPVKIDSQKVNSAQAKSNVSSAGKPAEQKPEVLKTEPKPYIAKAKGKGPALTTSSTSGKSKVIETNSLAQVNDQKANITVEKPIASSETAAGNVQPSLEEEKASKLDVTSVPVAPQSFDARKKEASQSLRAAKSTFSNFHKITGQVLSATDGSPLPGVNVIMKGTAQGTVTDASGYFQMNVSKPDQALVFSFIGYEQQEINAGDKDKVDITMREDATQLSEVVVTGYGGTRDDNAEPVIKLAEPVGGRKAYDKYLDDNLRYPQQALENKVKGRVVVEFTVRTDGSLDEFNVVKKLGYGCDEEVIRLVKEGPAWKPTTQDNVAVESNVRVRMKFNPDGKK